MKILDSIQEICFDELSRFYFHYVFGAKKVSVKKRRPNVTSNGIITEQHADQSDFDAYFDQDGKLVRSFVYYVDSEQDIQLSYNSFNKLEKIKHIEISLGKLIREGSYTYDTGGKLVSKTFHNYSLETGDCNGIETYKFTHDPNEISYSAKLDDYNEPKKNFRLDSQDRIIEVRSFSWTNKLKSWIIYSYDDSGKLEKIDYKNTDGKVTDSCQLIYQDDLFVKEIHCSVDKANLDGVAEYEYKLNHRGDTIEMKMLMDGELKWVEKKTIKYYNDRI